MRSAMTVRDMRAIAVALKTRGVDTHHPYGGVMEGTLSIAGRRLILQVDVLGRTMLYDPAEGTLNHRIARVAWRVAFGRGWVERVVEPVVEYLRRSPLDLALDELLGGLA